jgi:hypothetical protein
MPHQASDFAPESPQGAVQAPKVGDHLDFFLIERLED